MKHRSPTNDDAPLEPMFDWPPDYFDNPDELIVAAHQYFATDFPNPERRGCPAPGAYQSLASARRPLNAESRAHLFGCSECFNEYRAAALDRRHRTVSNRFARANAWLSRMNVARHASRVPFAAGVIALLLLAAGLFVWRHRQTASPQFVQTRPQPAPANAERVKPEVAGAVSAERATGKLTPEPQTSKKADDELLAANIDLNDYRSLGAKRRGDGAAEPPIPLPRARLRLTLLLRENSAAGTYRVSIVDASEKVRGATTARNRNGRKLQVTLDLRRVAGSQARLRIERANQPDVAPEEYNIEITRP